MSTDSDVDPFLLHESSPAFLRGDRSGIEKRFQYRRDIFDYGAMIGVAVGALLLTVNIAHLVRGTASNTEQTSAVAALALAGLMIAAGGYYVTSRMAAAKTRARLIHEGRVLPGSVIACVGRELTTSEAALGEVGESYLVAVEYRFTMPMGEERTDHDESNRRDLRRVDLPGAGAPIRVLYLDERTYALL
jgi:hypothetical protein